MKPLVSAIANYWIKFKEPYQIRQVPVPKDVGPYDLLVKTAVASLCHTDFMVADGVFEGAMKPLPMTGSHEGTGTVAAVGSKVSDFKEGDRVMCGLYLHPCGVCGDCQAPVEKSWAQYCENSDGAIGVNVDGAFAEYFLADSRHAARLPDKVSFETAAPLACAGCTMWRGMLQTGLSQGEWVAIVGSGGGLGHLGVQFAKAMSLNVIGVDARDGALELSKKYGADLVVDARKGDEAIVAEIKKVTNGEGADATVSVSDAESAAATACAVTKRHGLLVQIAQPPTVNIPFLELVFRDIKVIGSKISNPQEARNMLEVVARHNISVTTNPFNGLGELPKLVELAESGKMMGKGVIVVDQDQIKEERKVPELV